jgi:hypothetical protein
MQVNDKKQRLLKAKIAIALQDEFGRVATEDEIDKVFHPTRVMYKAVLGLHYKRREQKKSGQLAIFYNTYAHWLRPHIHHRSDICAAAGRSGCRRV